MPATYPTTLPAPSLQGLSATVAMGVIRSDVPGLQAQRRVHRTMPHTFTLVFTMTVQQWGVWYSWALANGFRWFSINLPSLYAGLGTGGVSSVLVRFTSDLSATNLSKSVVQVTVQAESAPSMIATYLANT